MLSVIMLSVGMLSVIMLSGIMLSFVMPIVVASIESVKFLFFPNVYEINGFLSK